MKRTVGRAGARELARRQGVEGVDFKKFDYWGRKFDKHKIGETPIRSLIFLPHALAINDLRVNAILLPEKLRP